MYNMLIEIAKESSTNKKQSILEDWLIAYPEYVDFLHMALDPYQNSYIKGSLMIDMEVGGDQPFSDTSEGFKDVWRKLSTREVTGNDARTIVARFLHKCDMESKYVYQWIIQRDLRCGMNVKTVNKVLKKLKMKEIPEFAVQLANKYEPTKKFKNKYWYISPKLDGLRCIYLGGSLYTRSGREIVGFDHVIKACEDICINYGVDTLDGELYSHDIPFQTIQSYAMKSKNINPEETKLIKFNIFAVLGKNIKNTKDMVSQLDMIRDLYFDKSITVVEQFIIKNDPNEILSTTEDFIDAGYEGAMLRHDEIHYEWKRSNSLVKYKFFQEVDLEVTGVFEGTGKYEGMLGGLVCKGTADGHTVTVHVGSGFTDEERDEIWKNQSEYIGQTVEVKYQNLTDDFSSLRFPTKNKFKQDR